MATIPLFNWTCLYAIFLTLASSKNIKRLSKSDIFSSYDHSFLHESITTKGISAIKNIGASNDIPIVYITDFGGDPSGINDSTTAFIDAIDFALTYGSPNATMTYGVKDLGGVTINLAGGDYKISKPL